MSNEQPTRTTGDTLLDRMEKERIFSVRQRGDTFLIMEQCDCYFSDRLTRDELLHLGKEIVALAETGQGDISDDK